MNLGKLLLKWAITSHQNVWNVITLVNGGWSISYKIALRWMPQDLTDDKSTLVQVLAWWRQATSHYLSQCWPTSMSPYGVTRPQWVKSHYQRRLQESFIVEAQGSIFIGDQYRSVITQTQAPDSQHYFADYICAEYFVVAISLKPLSQYNGLREPMSNWYHLW